MDPTKHTQSPIVTGTSVVALKYDGGVLLAADTLGSYGSLARFKDIRRIVGLDTHATLVGAGGDYSDFQAIEAILDELVVEDQCVGDGAKRSPAEIHSYLTRILYHRRSKYDPLWNSIVVAGPSFLATSDMIGTSYECYFCATGFGMHLAMPILRTEWREDLTYEEARDVLVKCMKVLFYRDCRTLNRITFGRVDASGAVAVEEPVTLDTEWSYELFVKP